jgi:Leucine-rich repeat (LRR) protein
MKFVQLTLLFFVILKTSNASHNCSLNYEIRGSYIANSVFRGACTLQNLTIENEITEIKFLSKENFEVKVDDIHEIWIEDSVINKLPAEVFDKFLNLLKLKIVQCSGFKNFSGFYFHKSLMLISVVRTSLEIIESNSFRGFLNVRVLKINENQLAFIQQHSFDDLINVEHLEIEDNKFEILPDNIFAQNTKLRFVSLKGNRLKVISSKLFPRNLVWLDLQNNSISEIERDNKI